jgi:hypothetical protein
MAAKTRQIAPRLADGTARDLSHGRLAPAIKAGLRAIARSENKSMSWVIEEVLIDYFGLRQPKYIHEVKLRVSPNGNRRSADRLRRSNPAHLRRVV